MIDSKDERHISLEKRLSYIAQNIQVDNYMLLEYLIPVIDGCRAALNVSIDRAKSVENLSESEFEEYMNTAENSFRDIGFCFKAIDVEEEGSLVFIKGKVSVIDECLESNVTINARLQTLLTLLDTDSKISPVELLGSEIEVEGEDSQDVVQGLGLLCYPSLLRIAESGIDPSSLLVEDADSIIMAAASDLVVKMIRKWINLKLTVSNE
ncbi:hypothetical protein EU527_03265 [Candidatus Thorarchaeota archaeon]|nr:MAG: hypothetical protein EU527_03265 [Candidatus Thorarchaeota archaeon]